MEIKIRKAIIEDSPAILALIKELAVFEKEPDAVEVNLKTIQNDGFGATPLFQCFVAEVAKKVVGMALFYPRYSTWKGPTFHLEDLIVTENMKGKGVGTKLYSAFIEYGYQQGAGRIEWAVLDWNEPAISFYKNSGASILSDWFTVQMNTAQMSAYLEKTKKGNQ